MLCWHARRPRASVHDTTGGISYNDGMRRGTSFARRVPRVSPRHLVACSLAVALAAGPALAHHRQMPPVAALTTSGDTALPRVPPPGQSTMTLAIDEAGDTSIVTIRPFAGPSARKVVASSGDNANPALSTTGRGVVWDTDADPLGLSLPGRQVVASVEGVLSSVSDDPTGTSGNPAIDRTGLTVVFESTGDLAGTGNSGARQIFVRDRFGTMRQLSSGVGASRNPVITARGDYVAFESTSDPLTGADTGVEQVWLGSLQSGVAPLTAGAGPSRNASISNDARLVAFESEADLGGSGADTGVPQIFVYDIKTANFARVTSDTAGCTLPAIAKHQRDWRVAFVCAGKPYFYMLRADQRLAIQADGGTTSRVIPELGSYFLALSTTANLLGSGATPGKQVYLINIYKRPPVPVAGSPAVWFPFRGIPEL